MLLLVLCEDNKQNQSIIMKNDWNFFHEQVLTRD
jgi:hypothetical protein